MDQDDLMPAWAVVPEGSMHTRRELTAFRTTRILSELSLSVKDHHDGAGDPSRMQYGMLTVEANTIMCETKLNR
jgi:hypothetical protein